MGIIIITSTIDDFDVKQNFFDGIPVFLFPWQKEKHVWLKHRASSTNSDINQLHFLVK